MTDPVMTRRGLLGAIGASAAVVALPEGVVASAPPPVVPLEPVAPTEASPVVYRWVVQMMPGSGYVMRRETDEWRWDGQSPLMQEPAR